MGIVASCGCSKDEANPGREKREMPEKRKPDYEHSVSYSSYSSGESDEQIAPQTGDGNEGSKLEDIQTAFVNDYEDLHEIDIGSISESLSTVIPTIEVTAANMGTLSRHSYDGKDDDLDALEDSPTYSMGEVRHSKEEEEEDDECSDGENEVSGKSHSQLSEETAVDFVASVSEDTSVESQSVTAIEQSPKRMTPKTEANMEAMTHGFDDAGDTQLIAESGSVTQQPTAEQMLAASKVRKSTDLEEDLEETRDKSTTPITTITEVTLAPSTDDISAVVPLIHTDTVEEERDGVRIAEAAAEPQSAEEMLAATKSRKSTELEEDTKDDDTATGKLQTGTLQLSHEMEDTKEVEQIPAKKKSITSTTVGSSHIDEVYSRLPLVEGWIEKKSTKAPYRFQKRWVVIGDGFMLWTDKRRTLRNGRDAKERALFKGFLDLRDVKEVRAKGKSKTGKKFEVVALDPRRLAKGKKPAQRTYEWRTKSKDICRFWVDGLLKHKAEVRH